MKILYIGDGTGTSKHRADALKRLGYEVIAIDPFSFLPDHWLIHFWQWRTGGIILENIVRRRITSLLEKMNIRFDITFINHGELIGPKIFEILREYSLFIVNYNVDDPFGGRDLNKWYFYLKSLPLYDLVVVVRKENVDEAYAYGAKKVIHVFRSADEIAHTPCKLSAEDIEKWSSDILFVGTWMPERGPFMAKLIEAGVPLSIYGSHWNKAKEWNLIQKCWKGSGLHGDDYAKAIQSAKACLGLLSKANRDLHTQRSLEVPYLNGLLCAERTEDHLQLYKEDQEAVFWSDTKECIEKCFWILDNYQLSLNIKENGRIRCIENENLNEKVLKKIINISYQ